MFPPPSLSLSWRFILWITRGPSADTGRCSELLERSGPSVETCREGPGEELSCSEGPRHWQPGLRVRERRAVWASLSAAEPLHSGGGEGGQAEPTGQSSGGQQTHQPGWKHAGHAALRVTLCASFKSQTEGRAPLWEWKGSPAAFLHSE